MKILSVDGGGRGFRKAVVENETITMLEESKIITSSQGLIDFVARDMFSDVEAISFAVAGDIEHHQRVVISPNCRFLNGLDLAALTRVATDRQVLVCNDMEAAATGMSVLFPDLKHFMGITWSSGIGMRIVMDGKVIGESEAGHMQFDPAENAPICGCGRRGCADVVLGGIRLQETVRNAANLHGDKIPERYKWPSVFLDDCYNAGLPWAVEISDKLVYDMARFLANLQSVLRFPVVVWKGGVAKGILLNQNRDRDIILQMRGMLMNPAWADDLRFYHSSLAHKTKDADSLIGAAKILRQIYGM